jgi:hypothetical protein
MPGDNLSWHPRETNCNECQTKRFWPSQSDVLVTTRAVPGVQPRAPKEMEGDLLPATGAKGTLQPHANLLVP